MIGNEEIAQAISANSSNGINLDVVRKVLTLFDWPMSCDRDLGDAFREDDAVYHEVATVPSVIWEQLLEEDARAVEAVCDWFGASDRGQFDEVAIRRRHSTGSCEEEFQVDGDSDHEKWLKDRAGKEVSKRGFEVQP